MSFTVVSTFAGCGGSSLGYQMAGYDVRLAVEWDDHAVECYQLNFPETPIYHGDVQSLSVYDVIEMSGLMAPGELDVLDGSPPCQGFSTAGRRQYHDTRNSLFREYARLINELQPKVFIMENVSGLVKGKMKLIFADVMRTLKACGYAVSARLLNAMYFGVPQSRQRIIFIGVRLNLVAQRITPSHPKPQIKPITVREALASPSRITVKREDEREAIERLAHGKWGKLYAHVPQGKNASYVVGSGFNNVVKPHLDKPSPTITSKGTDRGYATMVHPTIPRALNINEAKILHSYPESFQLTGSYEKQWARIGNSVPPLMMKVIAEHIRDEILTKCEEHDFVQGDQSVRY